ncbi:centromere protein I-like [Eriocheir sinensis]|uniref:centromere protein I-like n=1 Tax=Eriocheir sinensis TaxID=95602 RepID=UPI0021C7E1DE|nr:centromere protein I-like [Eriocheir sinensis]XP_050697442.1 centromere protein I-like [Eriocheir sinensis]XP_050697443.1 centromere protein I-like [Eriocheir sinensis]XP_050697444.1 centromere protein I-like [Eriocheir sinensis]XP_050697445.1 centromere protein I-like [Eriocheir sinensis]XP_050697446.1 centromere protein I-like [Eriocheir sinensis]XP_050697448.1 centromere protein I-like [Eriocheir sinensis]XP_050697449.1 centromere protein I-like [Eriocheir sinensis]XP_050697450.1 cent
MAEEELQEAINFLISNKGKRPKDVSVTSIKERVVKVEKAALEGLDAATIATLATVVIFTEGYNIQIRRRLLHSLIPKGPDFPLQVVPLAVSSAAVKNPSLVWQLSVLVWLKGLLEFGVVLGTEPLVHICYTSVFNMTSTLMLCPLACSVLYHMTVREDVTPNRIQTLLRLEQKPAYCIPTAFLLRLYHLFRPDMVVARLSDHSLVVRLAPALKTRLLNARQRMQDSPDLPVGGLGGDRVWQDGTKAEKFNVYQRPSAIPQPQISVIAATVEEQKEKVLYTTQYQRFLDMVRGLDQWGLWVWPGNSCAHLSCPLVISLFRPHHKEIQVHLTNWLEVALRTEVIEGIGTPSMERRESLLRATLELCRATATTLPVVNNFLVELMAKWNYKDHLTEILELLQFVTFSSLETMLDTLIQLTSRLLLCASLVPWCRVVEALTNTACQWALTAHRQAAYPTPEGYEWPQQVDKERAVMGLWILTERMERYLLAGVINHHAHPLALHHTLDYYEKVSQCCERLKVPLTFFPPPIMTLVVMTSHDLTVAHRFAQTMASMKRRMGLLEKLQEEGVQEELLEECLYRARYINENILLFLGGVLMGKALTPRWREKLELFYPFDSLEEALKKREAERITAITHNLAYLPLATPALTRTKGTWTQAEFEEAVNEVLDGLREMGLTGIEECSKAYRRGEGGKEEEEEMDER